MEIMKIKMKWLDRSLHFLRILRIDANSYHDSLNYII